MPQMQPVSSLTKQRPMTGNHRLLLPMKTTFAFSFLLLATAPLGAADAPAPKDEIIAAAAALAAQPNYSWTATVVVPEDARWKPGPTTGTAEKGGYSQFKMSFGDNAFEAVLKGEKGVANTPDIGWQTFAELDTAEGAGRFMGAIARSLKTPADQAKQLAGLAGEFKKNAGAYEADLTEAGAKSLQTMRLGGGDGPTVTNPKGSVKFWLQNGALVKYEFHVAGNLSFNGNDFPNDRTTKVEIKDVGTAKLQISEDAKKKLQ